MTNRFSENVRNDDSSPDTPVIGIDVRKYSDFGIGSYIRHLLDGLCSNDHNLNAIFRLYIEDCFLPDQNSFPPSRFPTSNTRFGRRSPFQGKLPGAQELALYHAPHYLTPDCRPSRLILTVHDCIHMAPPQIPDANRMIGKLADRMFDVSKRLYHRFQGSLRFAKLVQHATEIIAVSQATANQILDLIHVDESHISVIHNCLNSDFYKDYAPETITDFCSRYLLPFRDYVLYCGNDLYHKNLAGLLAAWARLCKKTTVPLLVLAGPPRHHMIEEYVRSLGITNKVRLIQRMPTHQMPLLYRGALCTVLPSFAEGFGLPVIESMISGTPVACSDLPVLREISGGHAAFFNPGDPINMMEVIDAVIRHSGHNPKSIRQAAEFAARYNRKTFLLKHTIVYNRLLEDVP